MEIAEKTGPCKPHCEGSDSILDKYRIDLYIESIPLELPLHAFVGQVLQRP